MYYISIYADKRKGGRLYEIVKDGIKANWIDTKDLLSLNVEHCHIILHANDVRLNSVLRNKIISHGLTLGWTFHLFTNEDSPGTSLPIFAPNSTVFDWGTIERNFPDLPPKVKNNLICLYLLCKGYLAGLNRFTLPEDEKRWWKFVQDADFKSEIIKINLKESDARDQVEGFIKELRNELNQESMDLSKIVTPLKEKLSEIEQDGGFL